MATYERVLDKRLDTVRDVAAECDLSDTETDILLRYAASAWVRSWIDKELDDLLAYLSDKHGEQSAEYVKR